MSPPMTDPPFGSAGALWVLANGDGPMTSAEIADAHPADIGATGAASTLLNLYRKELVLRRKRRGDPKGAYEYVIAPLPTDDAPEGDDVATTEVDA